MTEDRANKTLNSSDVEVSGQFSYYIEVRILHLTLWSFSGYMKKLYRYGTLDFSVTNLIHFNNSKIQFF